MKFNWVDIIMILLLLVVCYMLYDNAQQLKSDGYACKLNPFVYGAKEYSRLNNAEMIGSAGFIGGGPAVILSFDKNNLSITNLHGSIGNLNTNLIFPNVSS